MELTPIEKEFFKEIHGREARMDGSEDVYFMDEAKAAAALCEKKMNQWVSVKERLPNEKEIVIVFAYRFRLAFYQDKEWWEAGDEYRLNKPTHWMPLEPPKDLTEKKTT